MEAFGSEEQEKQQEEKHAAAVSAARAAYEKICPGLSGVQTLGANNDYTPYELNGGTVMAIAGDDFVVAASDTRMSSEMTVVSREQNKLFQLTAQAVMGTSGCWADAVGLSSSVKLHVRLYEQTHRREMPVEAMAQMISIIMYKRRLFPYFANTILAGIDRNGRGIVYYFDPVGHFERCRYRALGTAGILLMPTLDSVIGWSNHYIPLGNYPPLTEQRAIDIAHDSLLIAADRDIYTGDSGVLLIITKNNVEIQSFDMRKD